MRRLKKLDGFFWRPCEGWFRDSGRDDGLLLPGLAVAESGMGLVMGGGADGEVEEKGMEMGVTLADGSGVAAATVFLEPPPNMRLKKPGFSFGWEAGF